MTYRGDKTVILSSEVGKGELYRISTGTNTLYFVRLANSKNNFYLALVRVFTNRMYE